MKIVKTPIKDLIIIKNERFDDSRGYFRELLIEKKINKKFCFSVISASKKMLLGDCIFKLKNLKGNLFQLLKGK